MEQIDVFIDTNILFYAHEFAAGDKYDRARNLIRDFWANEELPLISSQVIRELFWAFQKRTSFTPKQSQTIALGYLRWRCVEETQAVINQAFRNRGRFQLSIWDSLILASAQTGGAKELWTEDLNTGPDYGGVVAVNPLVL